MKIFPYYFIFTILIWPGLTLAAGIAVLDEVEGKIKTARKIKSIDPQGRKILSHGDQVRTGASGRATVIYNDGTRVRIFKNSHLRIEKPKGIGSVTIHQGTAWAQVPKRRSNRRTKFRMRTVDAVIGIRGTNLTVNAQRGGGTNVGLSSGAISVQNQSQEVLLSPGQMLEGVGKQSDLKNQIAPMPFALKVHSPISLNLHQDQAITVELSLTSRQPGQSLPIGFEVYVTVNHPSAIYNKRVRLDGEGKGSLEVRLPSNRGNFKELVIYAVMEDNWNVTSGVGVTELVGMISVNELKGLRRFEEQ